MASLGRMLNKYFKVKAPREPQPEYHQFRSQLKKDGITYKIDRSDGFIVTSTGRAFPFYGDWAEALDRYNNPQE